MIYATPIVMIFVAVYAGYKRKIDFRKMELWYFLLLFTISIAANLLLLKNTLFHSKFIPGDLKDGMYGFMGGFSFGAIILNLMISSFLLGLLGRAIGKKKLEPRNIHKTDKMLTKSRFPEWFDRVSHSLSGCVVGSALGIISLSIFKDKPLEDLGSFALGSVIGTAGFYSLAGIIVFIQKLKKRV